MTQSGDVVQRKAKLVLTVDLRHYANQHRQRIIQNQEPEKQTLISERGFNAHLGAFEVFPKASCMI